VVVLSQSVSRGRPRGQEQAPLVIQDLLLRRRPGCWLRAASELPLAFPAVILSGYLLIRRDFRPSRPRSRERRLSEHLLRRNPPPAGSAPIRSPATAPRSPPRNLPPSSTLAYPLAPLARPPLETSSCSLVSVYRQVEDYVHNQANKHRVREPK